MSFTPKNLSTGKIMQIPSFSKRKTTSGKSAKSIDLEPDLESQNSAIFTEKQTFTALRITLCHNKAYLIL
jgi:hypothetical protein